MANQILKLMGGGLGAAGGFIKARGLEEEGIAKQASYEDLASQYMRRSSTHVATAQRKASESRRVADVLESDARAKLQGGASDPSSVKYIAGLKTQGYYKAALLMAAGEQAEVDDIARAAAAKDAGRRVKAAGEKAGAGARIGSFLTLLEGMGKAVTLSDKYNTDETPEAKTSADADLYDDDDGFFGLGIFK
jgi:hypothetical protein